MKRIVKKNAKNYLALFVVALFVFSVWGGNQVVTAMATGSLEDSGYLDPSDQGGNSDVIDFGSISKEDGCIGTAMPENWDASSAESDYYIESLEQFNYFQTHSKSNNFEGLTIHLAENVALDKTFTGIGSVDCPFAGTFDGHGYSITKLSSTANGLFVAVEGATIQKLLIGGAKVTSSEANAGILAGTANSATVDRVVISKSKLTSEAAGASAVGGMFGRVTGEVTISSSIVRRLLIKTAVATSTVEGFVGDAEAIVTMEDCAVINSRVQGTHVNCSVLDGTFTSN